MPKKPTSKDKFTYGPDDIKVVKQGTGKVLSLPKPTKPKKK